MAFYGIPIEKKYPLDTEDDVRRAIADFNNCQHIKRKILADNINDRLRVFNMMVTLNNNNDFIKYIDKRFVMDITIPGSENVKNAIQTLEEYNEDVYNQMIKFVNKTENTLAISNYLRQLDERADRITREKAFTDTELLLTLDVVEHICESLYLISLQYNVSKDYVNKLLDDLEELYVAYHGSFIFKRKILCQNQYNTKCAGIKSELNILIGKRTRDMLDNKAPVRTINKMSRLVLRNEYGTDTLLVSYLKDKQAELKEYFSMQNRYFYSGYDFNKPVYGEINDPYSIYEVERDIYHNTENVIKVMNKYSKLNLEISYSDVYRLQKRVDYIKQIPVKGLSSITMISMNEGQVYIVTKKKDDNTFYLIKYDDILRPSIPNTNPESLKGIKLIFKNEVLDDNIDLALESCTRF